MMARFPSHAAAAWYLAAIWDGEGSIFRSNYDRVVAISNTDDTIIAACTDALDLLGIEYRTYTRSQKRANSLPITLITVGKRVSQQKFAKLVPIQCERKQRGLLEVLKPPEFKGYVPRVFALGDIDRIRSLYESGLSLHAVAQQMGYEPGKGAQSVRALMVRNGIERRSRGGKPKKKPGRS